MRTKSALGCAVVSALAVAAPQAVASEAVPLTARDGVVVTWQASTRTAVVVTTNQRVMVIHSLRRYGAGRWIRIRGVKWGSFISGVKWGYRPWGVKWAIAMARNGTYRASLKDLGQVKHLMSLRAVVLHRNKRRMVVSVPGASWNIRFGRNAVWLPGPKQVNGAPNGFGATAQINLRIGDDGKVVITRARQVRAPRVGTIIPFAGTVVSRNATKRLMTVQAGGPSGVTVTLTVPTGVDLARYPIGSDISGTVATAPDAIAPVVTGISRNDTFSAADAAATTIGAVVPPGSDAEVPGNTASTIDTGGMLNVPSVTPPPGEPSPDDTATQAQIQAITAIRDSWSAASTGDPLRIPSTGLAEGQGELLSLVNDSIVARRRSLALLQLVAFELVVGAQQDTAIDPAYQAEIIGKSTELRISLLQTM